MRDLTLERREQADKTPTMTNPAGGMIMMTPPITEDYWEYRVQLNEQGQAIVGFPKFTTIGIGFAQEEDWNTNLPYTSSNNTIFDHIIHNKADDNITDGEVRAAIAIVQAAAKADRDPKP